ncbi:hypothetical protein [Devosia marina]|uniref:hypothetical protein n=1 Tax=Devosia marina TaxID=2683198 RepID=UPI0015D44D94|nr:hypothetical protein [Devosia marina]
MIEPISSASAKLGYYCLVLQFGQGDPAQEQTDFSLMDASEPRFTSKPPVKGGWTGAGSQPNVWVTDASAFASGGVSGITLTIMAQTERACRRPAKQNSPSNVAA